MADWAGKTLGKVHIDDLIARGGMAEVYTGTHESFGQVAVKVMRGLLERDSDQLARFQREAEVVAELKHPHIVQLLDYTVVDETPCITMEYINGPSLATYLKALHERKQRLPIGIVAQLLIGIASALDYAHSKGIIHRDIKPANVLLRSATKNVTLDEPLPLDVEPILTDFGLVRLLDSTMHTTTGSVSGTPAYMSPEQSRGEKVDKRTDIYSLGIMLYEMLAGAVPFQADTTFGMLMKHINEPPPVIKGISLDLQALLDRSLAKDPSLRYNNAGELASEFLSVFNGQTISPGTLHMAELARQAAQSSQADKPKTEERPSRRWLRIAIEGVVALILAFTIFQFVLPPITGITPTSTPFDPNIPVGRVRFDDFAYYMDSLAVSLNIVPRPEEGTHFEVWLLGDNGEIRDIGPITFTTTGVGRQDITDPNEQNLLRNYHGIQITVEQDDVSISKPAGEVIYSSIFPPQALVHLRHLLVSFNNVPDKGPLVQNLWYYSASYIDRSINGNSLDEDYNVGIAQAFESSNEALIRIRTEEIINLIVGDSSDRYLDYNIDGEINNPGDGYGSLQNGDRLGYLQDTALHAKYAADSSDSTQNIRSYSENIQICISNMDGWTNQILDLAFRLNETPFGPDMKPTIDELSSLGKTLVVGFDANGNGIVEATSGECGANTAYEHAYFMADMFILPGPNRVPPSGK